MKKSTNYSYFNFATLNMEMKPGYFFKVLPCSLIELKIRNKDAYVSELNFTENYSITLRGISPYTQGTGHPKKTSSGRMTTINWQVNRILTQNPKKACKDNKFNFKLSTTLTVFRIMTSILAYPICF